MAATGAAVRPGQPYPFSIEETDGPSLVRLADLFAGICNDARSGVPVPEIAFRFHLTVARMISEAAAGIASRTGIKTVVLSGGCFQNRLLTRPCRGPPERCGPRLPHPQASPMQRRRHQPGPGSNRPREDGYQQPLISSAVSILGSCMAPDLSYTIFPCVSQFLLSSPGSTAPWPMPSLPAT